ncbi:MAG: VOC family protein [Balneolaceae bacterium]
MKLKKIIETCLYAENLEEAEHFYTHILKLKIVGSEEGRHLFFKCGKGMLLIFNPNHTKHKQTHVNGNIIPLHGSNGDGHIAFSVENYDQWKDWLQQNDVEIESIVNWPNGVESVYFRDPAGNSVELVQADIWNLT